MEQKDKLRKERRPISFSWRERASDWMIEWKDNRQAQRQDNKP